MMAVKCPINSLRNWNIQNRNSQCGGLLATFTTTPMQASFAHCYQLPLPSQTLLAFSGNHIIPQVLTGLQLLLAFYSVLGMQYYYYVYTKLWLLKLDEKHKQFRVSQIVEPVRKRPASHSLTDQHYKNSCNFSNINSFDSKHQLLITRISFQWHEYW